MYLRYFPRCLYFNFCWVGEDLAISTYVKDSKSDSFESLILEHLCNTIMVYSLLATECAASITRNPKYNESCVISVAPGYEFSCRAAGRRTWSQSLAPAMGPFLCEVKVLILESHCFEKEVFEATRIVGGGFLHSSYNRIQEIGSRNYLN